MRDLTRDLLVPTPLLHEKPWGGQMLRDLYGGGAHGEPVGECWGIAAHPHGDCPVEYGPFAPTTLGRLWNEHRELFGGVAGDRFPLLVKVIDAERDLSVQVHPGDAYAAAHEGGSLGKRECWYVLDADEGAHVVLGQRARTRGELAPLAAQGRWEGLLDEVPCHAGDFFMVDWGRVHALGAGTLVLEVQQSSDVTYRLYDYGRRQADGTLRELHLERALDVIDFGLAPVSSGKVTAPERDGVTRLASCPDFVVDRVRVDGARELPCDWPFLCASVVEGSGTAATSAAGVRHGVRAGTHLVVPSGCGALVLEGRMTLVLARLP